MCVMKCPASFISHSPESIPLCFTIKMLRTELGGGGRRPPGAVTGIGKQWPTMIGHSGPWLAKALQGHPRLFMAAQAWLWLAQVGLGWPRLAKAGQGRPRPAEAGRGRPRPAEGQDWPSLAMATGQGRPGLWPGSVASGLRPSPAPFCPVRLGSGSTEP